MPALSMKSRKRGGTGGKVSSSFNGQADAYWADPETVSAAAPAPAANSHGGGFFGGRM